MNLKDPRSSIAVFTLLLALVLSAPAAADVFAAPPTPLAPADSVEVPHPVFEWTLPPRLTGTDSETRFDLWIWNSISGENTIRRDLEGVTWTFEPDSIPCGVPFTWWVQAVDVTSGERSEWSEPQVFWLPPDASPHLIAPVGTAVESPLHLTWSYSGAIPDVTFEVSIAIPALDETTTLTNVASGVEAPLDFVIPGRCYRWWVRALGASTLDRSEWSEGADFCYALDGGAVPRPISPVGGIGDESGGPYLTTFTWDYPAGGQDTVYDLMVECRGNAILWTKEGIAETSYTLSAEEAIPADSAIQFWVRARNVATGGVGEWSPPTFFNTLDAPSVVGVDAVTARYESVKDPLLRFQHPHYLHLFGMSYDLQIYNPVTGRNYTKSDFEGSVCDSETRQDYLGQMLPAGYAYSYRMRLRSRLFDTQGAWSAPASFSIPLYGGLVPHTTSPLGRLLPSTPVTFQWSFLGGDAATRFDLHLVDLTSGQTFDVSTKKAGTSFTPKELDFPLTPGHAYQWQIRSRDGIAGGVGSWSSPSSFQILLPRE